jgi:hypothetical protein
MFIEFDISKPTIPKKIVLDCKKAKYFFVFSLEMVFSISEPSFLSDSFILRMVFFAVSLLSSKPII